MLTQTNHKREEERDWDTPSFFNQGVGGVGEVVEGVGGGNQGAWEKMVCSQDGDEIDDDDVPSGSQGTNPR